MPIPAAPRRAAPPRRKKEAPKPADELPAPSQEEDTVVPEATIPLPESTPNLLADTEKEKAEVLPDVDPEPTPSIEPSAPADEESPQSPRDSGLITERSTSPTLARSGDHDDVPEDARAPSPLKEDHPVALSEESLAELVEEGQKEIEERSGIDQPEEELEGPLAEVSEHQEHPQPDTAADGEDEPKELTSEPDAEEDAEAKLEDQPEEEDEAVRRARIAARLAKSGGFNPFAAGPPARKSSETSIPARKSSETSLPARKSSEASLPERRTSVEIPGSFEPTLHEEQDQPAQPLARRDADSLRDETGFPTTEVEEEDEPLDVLKRVEGDS